jgi:alkylation response protein AidB-like acyl-CoA dehydrogenase
MDVRLTSEQQQLRNAAAKLADDLGPGSVLDLADEARRARLEKAVAATGWRALRSDGASGVEVAIVAEEFGRGLVDVSFLGPVLADDLGRNFDGTDEAVTVSVDGWATDARDYQRALSLDGRTVRILTIGSMADGIDPTRRVGAELDSGQVLGEVSEEAAQRWYALALVTTSADILGAARGAHSLACDYAKIREQYGKTIGSYQAVAHLLAEGLALIEGSISVLRHAAWAVDELPPPEAIRAARVAKVYCARAARTICESSIQVHGGIGNTWECLAHLYLRRVLSATELLPVLLREIDLGLS